MDRKETTAFLSRLLISEKFSGLGKYWASEVTLDYGSGKGKQKRVDFMQYIPQNQYSAGGLEKGEFICYEIKSSKEDYHSGHGLNFVGEKNYLVMTMQTYKDLWDDLRNLPYGIGVMVSCPTGIKVEDEFQNPTPLTADVRWSLKIIRQCHGQYRTRSMIELLFCMLRSGKSCINDYKTAAALAKQIAELPERKEL